MLALRIIATVIMGISCLSCFVKNVSVYTDTLHPDLKEYVYVGVATAYGWLWRAFIIVALWLI